MHHERINEGGFPLISGTGDGFFSSAFQSRLIGNNLHNASMPECESQTMMQLCLESLFMCGSSSFFPCLIMTSVLLSWRSPSIRLHRNSKEPPYSWWIFTLSLASLPGGGWSKAAAGQATTTNHQLLEKLLYLNSFCDFR